MTRWVRRRPLPSPDACESLRQADRALVDAERRDQAAKTVADRLNEIRVRNHFADAIARAIRGGT